MLEICSLSFDYQDKPLLNNVQFAIKPGTLLHLKGGNGAGKTTLLKLLAGLLRPIEGNIYWQGHSIYNNLAQYQQNLCYVGHKLGLSSQLTVKENCLLDLHWQQPVSNLISVLEQFSLHNLADKPCSQLSMGQLRRVALLRLILSKTLLWLLDEPLVALDKSAITELAMSFSQHLACGGFIIMTSHQALPSQFSHCQEYQLC
ncbi:heme exporter ATP-binding protein CcmA [Legionella beliardensis]|uniref:Heme exporter ATP-binding protein CcmA n=1 Tax=Legionella beliardensis TaxID=91822 RepID=A0A378HZM3_9GAMM|nr:cytochrome c biogenesis heme-transporting ATPase CcmA [Legionella beliardensis]STX28388.1 heme exporter ATP-binding protein CcmA [Legionella beliardensis]